MENILTLGKLLSLWFCFLLHSILFLISQTSYRTYKIISSYELARPIMGTIFLVSRIFNCTHLRVSRTLRSHANYKSVLDVCRILKCVGGITCVHAQTQFLGCKNRPVTPVLFIGFLGKLARNVVCSFTRLSPYCERVWHA